MHRHKRQGSSRRIAPRQMILLGTIVACILLLVVVVLLLIDHSDRNAPTQVLSASREFLYEGGVAVDQVRLTNIAMAQSGQTLQLALHFQGQDAQGQRVTITSIPRLYIHKLKQPTRIAIELPNLVSWDYLSTLDLTGQDFVQGIFMHDQTLYLQLYQDVTASLEGQGGTLSMKLTRSSDTAWPAGYRVAADVIESIDYSALVGTLSGMGMTPTLCEDGRTVVMVSPIYERQRSAEAFAQTVSTLCQQVESRAQAQTRLYAAGELPLAQTQEAAIKALFGNADAQPLMRDARVIDYAPQAGQALIKRSSGAFMLLDETGSREVFYASQMPEITTGTLSHDGQIAALSTADDSVVLYQTGKLRVLGAPIAGASQTMAWTDEKLLYLMNGDPQRFYWVDPADSELSANLVDDHGGLDGRLIGRSSKLYLQDAAQGVIYVCNPSDRSRSTCALGYRCAVSQDGSTMVVQTGLGSGVGLKLLDFEQPSGEKLIGLGLNLYDFCVTSDGSYVYYLSQQGEGYALYRYSRQSGQTNRLLSLPPCALFATGQDNVLLINFQVDGIWWVCKLALEP